MTEQTGPKGIREIITAFGRALSAGEVSGVLGVSERTIQRQASTITGSQRLGRTLAS